MSNTAPTRMRNPEFRGRIGIARTEITPPVEIYSRTWGSAKHDVADGVHQPLLGTCLVFRDSSGTELILIAVDAIGLWPPPATVRKALLEQFSLQPHQLILHPSHSHSTPRLNVRHADRPGGHLITPYVESIPGICADLIEKARATLAPAVLSWTYGRCGLAFNRDAIDPDADRDVCGLNPSVKADDTLLVGRITDEAGKIRGTIVNYACHPVSMGGGNRLLSPDYAGSMREIVEKETDGAVCVFLHGASGDLTPRRSYESNVDAAEQNGREVGYAALSALASMFPPGQELRYQGIEESGTALGIWRLSAKASISTKLSGQVVTARLSVIEMPARAEIAAKLKAATQRFEIERLERALGRRDLVGDGAYNDMSCIVWRLGESFLVGVPAEAYNQFQVDLRREFPDAAVAVLNLANGSTTYLPKAASFARKVYQVQIALYEPNSLQIVTDQACAAMRSLGA